MPKGWYEHVPLMVKQGRFRIPDLHGAEKVQMADDRKQRSEVSGVSPAAGLTPCMKLHQSLFRSNWPFFWPAAGLTPDI
jgi:hypothetical protein